MSESPKAQSKIQTTFFYSLGNMKGMKIVVLIKISKLPIMIEETNQEESQHPFSLKTPQGQLIKQYEIINYIVNQSKENSQSIARQKAHNGSLSSQHDSNNETGVVNLSSDDCYTNSRMSEKLYQLRTTLFPLLEQFYQFLLGHKKTKKAKYDSLLNKIKKQITKLDADINQYPQMFYRQSNYLNIIISCEIFMICSLVFEEKFRKSKYFLFTMYQKTSNLQQFVQIFGKSNYSTKQYVPQQFEEQEAPPSHKTENSLPAEVLKVSEMLTSPIDTSRNDLLYNFFRTTFSQQESKKQYFPYFWMMYDSLNCCLIQFIDPTTDLKFDLLNPRMKIIQHEFDKFIKANIDYGVIGAYQQQKDKNYLIRGICCLGSKSYEQFDNFAKSNSELKQLKIHKIDVNNEKQKNEVEIIWEHAIENSCYEDVNVCAILPI